MATVEPGTTALEVDEFVIEPDVMPGRYVARLAIRYAPEQFATALRVAFDFLEARYAHVVVSGTNGSRNGDQVTVYFWSSGKRHENPEP